MTLNIHRRANTLGRSRTLQNALPKVLMTARRQQDAAPVLSAVSQPRSVAPALQQRPPQSAVTPQVAQRSVNPPPVKISKLTDIRSVAFGDPYVLLSQTEGVTSTRFTYASYLTKPDGSLIRNKKTGEPVVDSLGKQNPVISYNAYEARSPENDYYGSVNVVVKGRQYLISETAGRPGHFAVNGVSGQLTYGRNEDASGGLTFRLNGKALSDL
jgi:hypothetical protein